MSTGNVSKKERQREQLILALLQQPGLERAASSIGIFDGNRVADYQDGRVSGRISTRAPGSVFSSYSADATSVWRRSFDSHKSNGGQGCSACKPGASCGLPVGSRD